MTFHVPIDLITANVPCSSEMHLFVDFIHLAIKTIAKANVKRVWKELSGNSFSIQAKGEASDAG